MNLIEVSLHLPGIDGTATDRVYTPLAQISHILIKRSRCTLCMKNGQMLKVSRKEGQKVLDVWAPKTTDSDPTA